MSESVIGGNLRAPDGSAMPVSSGRIVGDLLYLSGQLAFADGKIQGETIAEQTNFIFDNIEKLLAEAGLTLRDVVKNTVWITRQEDFPAYNRAYGARLAAPYPARSTVISQLAVPGALIEIEAIASLASAGA
jgi:2-iminobutanoate/2-iminopropanoate deaminase